MPPLYRAVATTHGFIAWDTCFAFDFDFNIALNVLKYYFLMFSFISVSCFSQNAFADRNDEIGSFFGFFSNSFSRFLTSLALSLT